LNVVAMDPSKLVVASRLGQGDSFGGRDGLGNADLNPGDGSAAQQTGGADAQGVVQDVGDRGQQPLAVLVPDVAAGEDPHHVALALVGAGDGLPVRYGGPAHRQAVGVQVGHGVGVGGDLHGQGSGLGLPIEEAAFHVGQRDRAGVVVGLVALVFGPVVPGGAPGVGVADQGVGVQVLQGLAGHAVLLRT
jgi:hypothetical protein